MEHPEVLQTCYQAICSMLHLKYKEMRERRVPVRHVSYVGNEVNERSSHLTSSCRKKDLQVLLLEYILSLWSIPLI